MPRGIVGGCNGIPKVASPVYQQNVNLLTGACLDSLDISIPAYPVQVVEGQIQLGIQPQWLEESEHS
jgi:nitrite reductase (NADH) small subunit